MEQKNLQRNPFVKRTLLALLFIGIGGVTLVVFSPWRPLLPDAFGNIGRIWDYLGRIVLIALLLVGFLGARKREEADGFAPVLLGLLTLAVAVTLDWISAIYLLDYVQLDVGTPAAMSLQKLHECLVVVSVVLAFTLLSGGKLGDIFIQKGKLKQSLLIGILTFVVAAAVSPFLATWLFGAGELTYTKIMAWLPWLLIFVFANATLEEVLFRGLFLKKLVPHYGKFLSVAMIALVFTVLHLGVSYTSEEYIFIAALLPLAFAWGYIMLNTDSIWGSILFHAGMDIPILLSLFSHL